MLPIGIVETFAERWHITRSGVSMMCATSGVSSLAPKGKMTPEHN
jgi:hypothetical protein